MNGQPIEQSLGAARRLVGRKQGASNQELMKALGCSTSRAGAVLLRLRSSMRVWSVNAVRNVPVRHFLVEEHANAYKATLVPKKAAALKRVTAGLPGHMQLVKGGTISLPAKKAPAAAQASEVVIPANVRRIVAHAPLGRFEVPAGAVLTGGFSTSRPGVDPLTGKAWGA